MRLAVLRPEVAETLGFNVETMDSFARLLSDVVYRRHPDVAALRGAGTGARAARTTRLDALRTAVEEAARNERFESEVVAVLDPHERRLVTELSAWKGHGAFPPGVASITQRVLRDRPEGFEYFRRAYGVRSVGELQSMFSPPSSHAPFPH